MRGWCRTEVLPVAKQPIGWGERLRMGSGQSNPLRRIVLGGLGVEEGNVDGGRGGGPVQLADAQVQTFADTQATEPSGGEQSKVLEVTG